jgi:hypothetical protein
MAKKRFSSRLASDEVATRRYKVLPLQSVQLSGQPCLRLQAVWNPLLTRWYSLGWFWCRSCGLV